MGCHTKKDAPAENVPIPFQKKTEASHMLTINTDWCVPYEGEEHGADGTVRRRRAWQWSGRQAAGLAPGALRAPRGDRGASVGRRVLPKHRLPAQQERDLERECRRLALPRRAVWARDGPRRG